MIRRNTALATAIFTFLAVFIFTEFAQAQPQLTLPRKSQAAKVKQKIGLTNIWISYHRPGVKGRTIWGDLVPYGKVWRAGANENTVIAFSDPVKINGKDLPAGKYGLHMIPTQTDWTIIFSKIYTAWGSYGYDEKNDALRITVTPQSSAHREWLCYQFDNPGENSVEVSLNWEKLRVPFKVVVDVDNVVLASIRNELYGLPQFYWQGWNQAANYCLQKDMNHEEALQWAEKSISMKKTFTNLKTKSGLLAKLGREDKAKSVMDEAMALATEGEMNTYGYQLMNQGKMDKAIKVFQSNVKNHPDSWNVYDSLAEAFQKNGNKKMAIKYYSKALKMVKDENQKNRIASTLKTLKSSN